MGGSGSGRRGEHARRRPVEEAFLALKVAALGELLTQPDGTHGTAYWGDGASLGVRVSTLPNDYCTLRVAYSIQIDRAPAEKYNKEVAAEPVRQPFGGCRWYFRCPRCNRRCACLYLLWTMRPGTRRRPSARHRGVVRGLPRVSTTNPERR
jgi:hypothetical protein